MQFVELATFDVLHKHLPWPWLAIDASRARFAFAASEGRIATRVLSAGQVEEGPSFPLPADLGLPSEAAPETGHRGPPAGLHGFSIDSEGTLLAVTGLAEGASVVVTLDAHGEKLRSRVDALAGGDFTAHAIAFDRSGTRLWLSAESGTETALLLLDARSHAVLGVLKSAPFPPPAAHELHLHHQDDAVLLLATCGPHGTFARVAGFTDGPPLAIPTAMDDGVVSAGLVGFSADGARVHLAEADELATRAWPALHELSQVEFSGDFVSSYSGAVLGHRIFVDGQEDDSGEEDAVMLFELSATRGAVVKPPVPTGMWVGRLGADAIVTVEAEGDPGRGRVVQLPAPKG